MSAINEKYNPFNLDEACCECDVDRNRILCGKWLLYVLLHHGMNVFGSCARSVAESSYINFKNSDIDAFFVENDESFSERLSCLMQNLMMKFVIEKLDKSEKTIYAMNSKVLRYKLSFVGCLKVSIKLDIVSDDLSSNSNQFDADINAFAITHIGECGEWILTYLNNQSSRKNALLNLKQKQFQFLLNNANTNFDLGGKKTQMAPSVQTYYGAVLRSSRWCKLKNAGFDTKDELVPNHGVATTDERCLLCAKKMQTYVWKSFCCSVKMHHDCYLRFLRRVNSLLTNEENFEKSLKTVKCLVCRNSPLKMKNIQLDLKKKNPYFQNSKEQLLIRFLPDQDYFDSVSYYDSEDY